jgi:tripeptidyl-peptidase-1
MGPLGINTSDIENPLINGTVFNPTFPASCPYVTAVGATQLQPDQSINDTESAMHIQNASTVPYSDLYSFSSGGGVSNCTYMDG